MMAGKIVVEMYNRLHRDAQPVVRLADFPLYYEQLASERKMRLLMPRRK